MSSRRFTFRFSSDEEASSTTFETVMVLLSLLACVASSFLWREGMRSGKTILIQPPKEVFNVWWIIFSLSGIYAWKGPPGTARPLLASSLFFAALWPPLAHFRLKGLAISSLILCVLTSLLTVRVDTVYNEGMTPASLLLVAPDLLAGWGSVATCLYCAKIGFLPDDPSLFLAFFFPMFALSWLWNRPVLPTPLLSAYLFLSH